MLRVIAKRVVLALPVLLITSFGVFLLISLVPGDPAVTLAGGVNATPERIAEIRSELKLDQPLLVQYKDWLSSALRLDFGRSLYTDVPVMPNITSRLAITGGLVLVAVIIGLLLGVPLGLLAAARAGRPVDHAVRMVSTVGIAVPNFGLAILLVVLFAVRNRVFPSSGYVPITESFGQWLERMIMPAAALGLGLAGMVARQLRASVVGVLESNYIRAAWAKGGNRRNVILKHGFKNAVMAPLTVLGIQIGYLLGGAVIVEQIFSIPGLGTLMLGSITSQDLPVLQGITVVFVLSQMLISLLIDMAYAAVNPKARVS